MTSSPESPASSRGALPGLPGELRKHAFTWLLVRGILALLLGLLLFLAPTVGAAAIGIFVAVSIGVWLIFDGAIICALAFRAKGVGATGWGWGLAAGILTILAGLGALIFPLAIAAFLGLFILWALALGLVVRGVAELGERRLGGWGIALGVIDILFGISFAILLIANPGSALVSLVWVGGIYGVIFGIAGIVTAFSVRKAR